MRVSPMIKGATCIYLRGTNRVFSVIATSPAIPVFMNATAAERVRNYIVAVHKRTGSFPRTPLSGLDSLEYIVNSNEYGREPSAGYAGAAEGVFGNYSDGGCEFLGGYVELREVSGLEVTHMSDYGGMEVVVVDHQMRLLRLGRRDDAVDSADVLDGILRSASAST